MAAGSLRVTEEQLMDSEASSQSQPANHLSLQGRAQRMIGHWAHLAGIRKGTVRGDQPTWEEIMLLPPA